jgi:ATP-dependent Clp protease ATP-binding subunit ClpC
VKNQYNQSFTLMSDCVLTAAGHEALAFNHPYIGAEHLLLAMLRDGTNPAWRALRDAGITHGAMQSRVLAAVGRGSMVVTGHIAPTPRVKRILELASAESDRFGDGGGDPRLLLHTLLVDGGGLATRILSGMGIDLRRMAADVLAGAPPRDSAARASVSTIQNERGPVSGVEANLGPNSRLPPLAGSLSPRRTLASRYDG